MSVKRIRVNGEPWPWNGTSGTTVNSVFYLLTPEPSRWSRILTAIRRWFR